MRTGGRYVWKADAPPVPVAPMLQAVEREDAPLVFEEERPGLIVVDGSSSRDRVDGWKGPVFEKFGMHGMSVVFYMLEVEKPGVLFLSEDLKEWRTVNVPDHGMNTQVIWFPGKDPRLEAVIGVGTPLMLKVVNGRRFFFAYQSWE